MFFSCAEEQAISPLAKFDTQSDKVTTMQTRQLGNSDLHITALGIGAWAFGGGGWNGSMGPQNEGDSVPAIRAALDHGLNWIDTAALYGLGHSEEVVARAIKGRNPRPYVFTKCERVWDADGQVGACLKKDSVRRECEESLRRLQVDVIDLYQIHWPEPDENIEEGWAELARLKEEGKVRYIGVSNFSADYLVTATVLHSHTQNRRRNPSLLPEEQNRGDCLFAHVGGSAYWKDDARSGGEF
jgi:aryl-alcohol dehydrogenase-like predicted oxidoreductase